MSYYLLPHPDTKKAERMDKMAPRPSDDVETLRLRFTAIWDRNLDAERPSKATNVAEIVIDKHMEHHRHYHNTRHLSFCLSELDHAQSSIDEPDVVELSIWFHDAVYMPNASDNENQSAALFLQLARGQLPELLCRTVAGIIQATHHQQPPTTKNEACVLDIDLASIGLPWEDFNRDNEALRAEVPRIHDNLYYEGKSSFLTSLLARDKIYFTKYFYDRFESRARDNIKRYLNS